MNSTPDYLITAAKSIKKETGINFTYQESERISFEVGGKSMKFQYVAVPDIYLWDIANVIVRLADEKDNPKRWQDPHPLLLVSRYLSPKAQYKLKSCGFSYCDAAGNFHLNALFADFYYSNYGQKSKGKPTRPQLKGFTLAGIRLIFQAFIQHDFLKESPYWMADHLGVKSSAINHALNALGGSGHILQSDKPTKRRLNKSYDLLEKWVYAYAKLLKDGSLIGRYIGSKAQWGDTEIVDSLRLKASGEMAAQWITGCAHLRDYEQAKQLSLYCSPEKAESIIADYALQPVQDNQQAKDDDVIIEFYNPILNYKARNEFPMFESLVNPILIYAEMEASNEPRHSEAADEIFFKYLKQMLDVQNRK